MAHTEGFEPDEDDDHGDDSGDGGNKATSAGRGASSSGAGGNGKSATTAAASQDDQTRAIARRQKTAMQLETLTEFSEHHLRRLKIKDLEQQGANLEELDPSSLQLTAVDLARVELLVDACLQLPEAGNTDIINSH
jgi:shikimate 5-dehydrogenase